MYPLLGFSVLSIAVILERIFYYFSSRDDFNALLECIADALKKENSPGAVLSELSRRNRPRAYLTALSKTYFTSFNDETAKFEEKLFVEGSLLVRQSETRLPVLSTLASISTLVGLFGTILGMIQVFQKLAALGGRADVALLSNGIWVALLTTAAGLVVAVPSLLFHNFFSRIVKERGENLELLISRLNIITGKNTGAVFGENTE